MLTKLLKYEARTTARMLLPFYAGLALAWCVKQLYAALYSQLHLGGMFPGIVRALLVFLFVLTALAAGAMTVYVNVRQFYRLLGEDGYLLIPLPVSAAQHMAAKLVCSTGWTVVYFLICGLLSWLEGNDLITTEGNIVKTGDGATHYYFAGQPLSVGTERMLNIGLVGLGVMAIVCGYLFLYLCIIIGGYWPQRRALASVLAYFGLSFAVQATLIAAVVGVANLLMDRIATAFVDWLVHFADGAQHMDAIAPMVWAIIGIAAAVQAVAGIALWAIDHHFVSKRLNIA